MTKTSRTARPSRRAGGGNVLLRRLSGFACLTVLLGGCAVIVREAKEDLIRVHAANSTAEIAITLDPAFIEAYKNRVTIDVDLTVDRADKRPHPAVFDGDFHLAGSAPGIRLPAVAEIQNAAGEKEASDVVRRAEGSGRSLKVAGAWRIWSEHVGKAKEIQGDDFPSTMSTNPDHVFEIHPLIRVAGIDLLESLRPVDGYRPGSADLIFRTLEKIPCRIVPGRTTTVVTPSKQFNDAEFLLEVGRDRQQVVPDGRFVNAAALDLKGNLLVPKLRMAFVKGSPPERIVRSLPPGSRLHVFGLPRIDLAEIASRTARSDRRPDLLTGNLPYEMVIVGVYEDRN
ncbi:MAG TPA: hypothetical protein VFS34_03430 [Thermoanaerobaculia bacterium]|nr:hypothetical protein [Thermoanaerobaculia bacterium]